jgi:hypothetical protein
MSYMLYKTGDKHVIFGRKCTYHVFMDEDVEQAISDGWVEHPKHLPDEVEINGETVLEGDIIDVTFEEVDTNNTGKLSSDEVRAAAKKEGIEGFKTKRISTLKKALGV